MPKVSHQRRLIVIVKYAGAWDERQPSAADIRRFASRIGYEYLPDLYPFWDPEVVALFAHVLSQAPPLSLRHLAITGQDVIQELGIRPGPEVGRILNDLMDAVLEKPALNQRDMLLEMVAARRA